MAVGVREEEGRVHLGPQTYLRFALLAQDRGTSGDPAGHDPEVTGWRNPG